MYPDRWWKVLGVDRRARSVVSRRRAPLGDTIHKKLDLGFVFV
jgi:hypothetical protein